MPAVTAVPTNTVPTAIWSGSRFVHFGKMSDIQFFASATVPVFGLSATLRLREPVIVANRPSPSTFLSPANLRQRDRQNQECHTACQGCLMPVGQRGKKVCEIFHDFGGVKKFKKNCC